MAGFHLPTPGRFCPPGNSQQGIWQEIHDALRKKVRMADGRKASPSAAIIDSQSVKTTEKGGLGATTQARRSMVASGM